MQSITDKLRKAIAAAERRGMTRYAIAKAAGIQQSQIHRVADGQSIPRLDTAERIARAINLEFDLRSILAN